VRLLIDRIGVYAVRVRIAWRELVSPRYGIGSQRQRAKALLYEIVRPLFTRAAIDDACMDFCCGECLEPVLLFEMCCSPECYERFEKSLTENGE
jgi:hypothetical protein